MWLNSMQREEPYQALTCISKLVKASESRKGRNPCELLPPERELRALCSDCPALTGRKVGTTSSQYGPYGLGCTRTTMPSTERSETARWRKSLKLGPVQIEVCNSTS